MHPAVAPHSRASVCIVRLCASPPRTSHIDHCGRHRSAAAAHSGNAPARRRRRASVQSSRSCKRTSGRALLQPGLENASPGAGGAPRPCRCAGGVRGENVNGSGPRQRKVRLAGQHLLPPSSGFTGLPEVIPAPGHTEHATPVGAPILTPARTPDNGTAILSHISPTRRWFSAHIKCPFSYCSYPLC